MEETLRKDEEKFEDEEMQIKSVTCGSLTILTTISADVLNKPKAFKSAVCSFLTKMVEVCNINTDEPCQVEVTLHILEASEGMQILILSFM